MMRDWAVQISPCSIATLQPMMPGTAFVDVDVVEHDRRRLAAQLERDAADVAPAQLGDPLAHGRAAGEAHLVHAGAGDEVLALGRVGDQHVDHARRQPRLLDRLGEDVAGEARPGPAP